MNMFKHVIGNATVAVALLGMTATQVMAVDLTGTWDGKASCSGFFNGAKVKDIFISPVTITQTGSDLNMEFLGVKFNGGVIDDEDAPTKKGQGTFISCGSAAQPLADYSEQGHFKVQTSGTKVTFTATSVFATAGGGTIATVETCKYTFKRTNPADPGVGDCS